MEQRSPLVRGARCAGHSGGEGGRDTVVARRREVKLESISISRICPAPYNPRKDLKPDDLAYQQLRRSIDEFGYVEPLVWNCRTGHLVGGTNGTRSWSLRGSSRST